MKERLKKLLYLESIKRVFIVDEEIVDQIDFEKFRGLTSAAPKELLKELTIEGISLADNLEISLSLIEEKWPLIEIGKKRSAAAKIAELFNIELAVDFGLADRLGELFESEMLTLLAPEDWDTQKATILGNLSDAEKILVFFDEDLKREDGRKGRDLIREIKDMGMQNSVLSILFSNSMPAYSDEITYRNRVVKDSEGVLSRADFFALSKSRKNKDDDFADGLKKALLNGYCERIKESTRNLVEKSYAQAVEKLDELDPYDFDSMILASSFQEGVWEGTTLQRISRIFYDEALNAEMQAQDYVQNINKAVRVTHEIRKEEFLASGEFYNEKLKIRHKEIYINGSDFNPLYLPIENGDIFEISVDSARNLFVLVGQECDLMLRSNGNRKSKIGYLLPLMPIALDREKTPTDLRFDYPYFVSGTNDLYISQFKHPVFVDLEFLDLTAYNSEGKGLVSLDLSQTNFTNFSIGAEKRLRKLSSSLLKRLRESVSKIEMIMEESQEALSSEIYPPFSFPERLLSYTFDGSEVKLPIQRVKRLRTPYAKNLLDKFTKYQSRVADPHDFAKDLSPKS